jgi:uncharacterized membrane protein YeaQ/YmgE (transglycosylase-associated protein family)
VLKNFNYMEQKPIYNTKSMQSANDLGIYKTLLLGIIIAAVGVFLRFAHDSMAFSLISWVILFVGAALCFKAVFKILGS